MRDQKYYEHCSKKQLKELLLFVEKLKSQWMATVDALVDPLLMIDENYNIKKVNKAMAKFVGKDVKDLIGKKCFEVFDSRTFSCLNCKMKTALKSKKIQQYVLENVKGNLYFEVTSQPIINADTGKVEGVVQIYRDRTEAKRLEEQLMQSEKLASIGLLAGGIAHELNNPLGGILIFAEVALKELNKYDDFKTVKNDIREIINAAQRCKSIVENLLQFARKESNGVGVSNPLVDINDALITALRFGRVGLKNKNIVKVKEYLSPKKLCLFFNRNKLIQVFLNLIQNAYQAMPDGGTLTVKTYDTYDQQRNRYAICEISDTGVGIPQENITKIFDPFFTTKDPGEGTGLGLSIAYSIVSQLKGQINVDTKLNYGTIFTIRIPIVKRVKYHIKKAS